MVGAPKTVVRGGVAECPMGVREVAQCVDFVYVMRRDSAYVAGQVAARLGRPELSGDFQRAYDRSVDGLAEALLAAFGRAHDRPAVDLIDAQTLDVQRLEHLNALEGLVISMDPLFEEDAVPLAFSRCYRQGGLEFLEMVPRPGYPPLRDQVARIRADAASRPLIVVEDDFYTGDTLTTLLGTYLGDLAKRISGVVPGTKVASREPDFPVHPAVRYVCEGGDDPLTKVDLGDPRDFIVGASGLVCRLASGKLGRLPYILPFVSTAARASVPKESERDISAVAIGLSRDFWGDVSRLTGAPVPLAAADPGFARACSEIIGLREDAALTDVLDEAERLRDHASTQQ